VIETNFETNFYGRNTPATSMPDSERDFHSRFAINSSIKSRVTDGRSDQKWHALTSQSTSSKPMDGFQTRPECGSRRIGRSEIKPFGKMVNDTCSATFLMVRMRIAPVGSGLLVQQPVGHMASLNGR
jgi:hypothetical protein